MDLWGVGVSGPAYVEASEVSYVMLQHQGVSSVRLFSLLHTRCPCCTHSPPPPHTQISFMCASLLKTSVRPPFPPPPPGRLINRFTKDTEAVDTQLAAAVNSALSCLVSAVLAIVVVVSVSPFTFIALLPLAALYYRWVLGVWGGGQG
jgi:ABC-type multidrug transport system fused ATPase/permease subunit